MNLSGDLLKVQDELQKDGREIIEELELDKLLSLYGKLVLVGSMNYGLMTWRDIDFDLVTEDKLMESNYWEIVKELFTNKNIKQLTLADNRMSSEIERPKSLYLGIKYQDKKKEMWKIDIRILAKDAVTTDRTMQLIRDKATAEKRETILRIKSQVDDNPKYHKEFSCVDIYKAVLLDNVRDLDGFKKYLKYKNR